MLTTKAPPQLAQISGFFPVVGHNGGCAYGQGDVCGNILHDLRDVSNRDFKEL